MTHSTAGHKAIFVCTVAEVTENQPYRATFADRDPIGVFCVDGTFLAIDDTCSHGAASLCEGFVESGQVECPFHSALFDLRTGEALTMPATDPVRSYPVEVEDGKIHVIVE